MYTRNDKTGWKQSTKFRKTFSREVAIEFIGVWDTVDSVGIIPKQLPFTGSNRIVRTFRHALSLDERRAKFKANMWNRPEPTFAVTPRPGEAQWPEENEIREQELRMSHQSQRSHASDSDEKDPSRPTLEWVKNDDRVQSKYEENFGSKGLIDRPTDVEEVWFAGCHCDVGGGSVKNTTRHSLAKISLRWMIRECFKTNSGIMFDSNRLRSVGLDPSSLHPFVTPRPSPIAVHTDMRIRPRVPGERAPGLIKQIVSDIEDSLPTFKTKVPIKRRGRMKELEVKADNDRTESMTPPRTAVQSASSKILGSVRNRFRRTVDSGKLPSKCAANPSSGDPSEVSVHPGRSLTEEEEDLYDAMSPKYDQLKLTPTWWILEYIPMQFSFQGDDDYRLTSFGMNRARPRHIPRRYSEGIKVHRTVRMRMETTQQNLKKGEHKRYVPKAPLDTEKIIWVD
ncbi:hypothetical protein VKT23_006039 [Stygiomarasmius scandens]|uniref:T6SS Phospholipase effector Tle1-like catalytic domain-containing protein n=1 Tax=Marasmiellus scandens TaxID=2682957 RepID=A0ABR1JPW2_9AGAR